MKKLAYSVCFMAFFTCSTLGIAASNDLFEMPQQSAITVQSARPTLTTTLDVPSLGAMPTQIEQKQEIKLGEMVLRQVAKEAPLFEDVWTQDELLKIFTRIYSTTSLGAPIGMVVINEPSINAFAVPGGLFALNTGLVISVRTVDELAGVMGHEIAHVSQRHYSRSKDAFKNQGWLSLGGMLASILLASQSPDAASAIALGTQAALIDNQLSYSRNQEREADRVGMQLMYAAGYRPIAMSDFFEVMNRKTGNVGFLPDFWLTHPLSSERMSEARLRAAQYPANNIQLDIQQEQNLRMMQYRILVLSGEISENRLLTAVRNDPAAILPLASFYTKQGQYAAARKLIEQAKLNQPDSSIMAITAAEIELAANQPHQALDILLPQSRILPENLPLSVYVANAYIALNRGQEALNLLQPLVIKNPRNALLWQTMEQAANGLPDSSTKTLQILRYRAENRFWRGDVDNAIRLLLRASILAKQNNTMQAKIDSRLSEMQEARQFKAS